MSQNPQEELRQKLAAEIDSAPWSALVRHFAFGRVYVVRPPWDLLDAALALHHDATELVKEAIRQKQLEQPSAEEAESWHRANASFDMLVISPFILIQTRENRQV
ncbi:DUF2288 family protein [Oligoflexus tunisiensis]|uniref:DUF2288 family protein n=1 Tax=Oligoflexus tunisiensis TaxID=708132 RepID=UPI00114D2F7C|nr:DUF2288 family protein [Oligoflexus tunisiensis]